MSTGRPEQEAPASSQRRAFAIKVLHSPEELVDAYRLRYEVYHALGYLPESISCKLEIDEYDRYAIPFGAIAVDSGELVGTVRLVTRHVQPFHSQRILRILEVANDAILDARVTRPRTRPLPSMISRLVEAKIDEFNTEGQDVEEGSRTVIHPAYRGTGVLRGLMEFFLAYAMKKGDPVLIAGCLPDHVPLYGRYGFQKLPGTDLDQFDSVGMTANTVICNTRSLPEPSRSHVDTLREAMLAGEPECVLGACVHQTGNAKTGLRHRSAMLHDVAEASGW
jgi:GNAT superfamily N-acetyltransferase